MGQRSQVYIRYKNKEKMVAMHLQWNYGYYMINRAYQLLDYISKNLECDYNNFTSENFDISNRNNSDETILKGLIQCNMTIGSFVGGYDLLKEHIEWLKWKQENLKEKENKTDDELKALEKLEEMINTNLYQLRPEEQDNNDGILVIDILDDKTIKYGFASGYDYGSYFTMINATDYMKDYKECLERLDEENKKVIEKQVEYINSFQLLTDEEYKEIFEKKYKGN